MNNDKLKTDNTTTKFRDRYI